MNAPSVWAIIALGAVNLVQVAERWHLVNRVTELADRMAAAHGDRVRVVAPPKQPTAILPAAAGVDGQKATTP